MNSDSLCDTRCGRCPALLERGAAMRSTSDDEAEVVCFDCGYKADVAEFLETGILRSSVGSWAFAKRDWEVYRPHFEIECAASPVFTAVWEKYKDHERLNHPKLKQGVHIDLATGKEYPRDWDSEGVAAAIADGSLVLEVADAMCGYRVINVSRKGDDAGMWLQGQVRPGSDAKGWYRSCYADQRFIDEVLEALRKHLAPPDVDAGTMADAWEAHVEDVRRQLWGSYSLKDWAR